MAFSGVHTTGSAAKQPQFQRPLQAIQDRIQAVPEAQDSDRLKLSEEILEDLLHSGVAMPNFEALAQSLAADPGVETKAAEKVGAAGKSSAPEKTTTVHWQPGHEPGKIIQPEGAIGIIGATITESKDKKSDKKAPPKGPNQAPKQPPRKPDRVELSPESKQQMKDLRESGAEESAAKIESAAEKPQSESGKQEQETTTTEVPSQIAYTKFPKWNQTAWIKEAGSFESKPGKKTLIRAFQNVNDQPYQVLHKLEPMQGTRVRELARENPIPELDKHQQKRLADPEMEFK
ncbi:MAG: hypothetical protein U0931_13380 [Vulcanimicrobiota bacterium]